MSRLMKAKILKKLVTPYSYSPCMSPEKNKINNKDDRIRVCIDFWKLNQHVQND